MPTYAEFIMQAAEKKVEDSALPLGEAAKNVWAIAHALGHQWAMAVSVIEVSNLSISDIWTQCEAYLAQKPGVRPGIMVPEIRHTPRGGWLYEHKSASGRVRAAVYESGYVSVEVWRPAGPCLRLSGTPGQFEINDDPMDGGSTAEERHWMLLLNIAYQLDINGGFSGAVSLVRAVMDQKSI